MTLRSNERVITAAAVFPLERFMRERGLDWRRAIETVGIDPQASADPDAVIPFRALVELLESAARESGNDAFGLQFGEMLPINVGGTIDYILLNARNLHTFLSDIVRFLSLIGNGFTARFIEGTASSHLIYDIPLTSGPRTQFVDMVCAALSMRIRYVAGGMLPVMQVEIDHPEPLRVEEFHRVLGKNVRFDSPECRFEFDNRVLHQPLAAADPQLYRIVRLHAQNKIAEHERAGDIVFRVTEYLAEAFKHGDVNLANAADSLGMSARTLQRELEEAGTSFRDLVDETRKSLAQHFLLGTSLPLTEIAFLLGFSELSAFSRAARVWFGAPPSDLRKSGAGQPSS